MEMEFATEAGIKPFVVARSFLRLPEAFWMKTTPSCTVRMFPPNCAEAKGLEGDEAAAVVTGSRGVEYTSTRW